MNETTGKRQVREIKKRIRSVLMEEWDPIGVKGIPEAADEYDGYVWGVYVLLRDGASDAQLAHHFANIETERMGLTRSAGADRHNGLIRRLRSLDLPPG